MNYIQKSKIKSLVRDQGFRLSPDAFDGINRSVENLIKQMLTKVQADGMKTLMGQHTGVVKVKQKSNDTIYGKKCQRCCNLDDAFLRKGQDEQRWFYDEVKRCSNNLIKKRNYDPHFATKQGRVNNFVNELYKKGA